MAKLPWDERRRVRGASFPTRLDARGHSIGGIETWIVRISAVTGEKIPRDETPEP